MNVTYVGAKGPLLNACEQVFKWKTNQKLIVVLWHEGWADEDDYWSELAKAVKNSGINTSTLIAFFEEELVDFPSREHKSRLALLFRMLGQDPDCPKGTCPITNFEDLDRSPVLYDSEDRHTASRIRANRILGFGCPDSE